MILSPWFNWQKGDWLSSTAEISTEKWKPIPACFREHKWREFCHWHQRHALKTTGTESTQALFHRALPGTWAQAGVCFLSNLGWMVSKFSLCRTHSSLQRSAPMDFVKLSRHSIPEKTAVFGSSTVVLLLNSTVVSTDFCILDNKSSHISRFFRLRKTNCLTSHFL